MHPLRNINNSLVISNKEKADFISTYLKGNFQPHDDIIAADHSHIIENSINKPLPKSFLTKNKSLSEIIFIIKKFTNKNDPSHNLTTNRILKNLPKTQYYI